MRVIDVDGSCLPQKQEALAAVGVSCAPLPPPSQPPQGWTYVSEANQHSIAEHIPKVYPSTLYQYLAEGVGNISGQGAFRALSRGYVHWASGRMDRLQVNYNNPNYCFVRCQMRPSMKPGFYTVDLLLKREAGGNASIFRATCQCAAG